MQKLAQAEAEVQSNMALAQIVDHLSPHAAALLQRLPVYQALVPQEGIIKIGLDLPQPAEALLAQLTAVSLVEAHVAPDRQTGVYQLSPLVASWLAQTGVPAPEQSLWQAAATYQHYLYRHQRSTLAQAIVVHQARQLAQEHETARRFALDHIVGPFNRAGLYHTLLDEWLPDICQTDDPYMLGEALGQTGKQHHHLGNFSRALPLFEQSLTISQEIGDKSGEGTTLNNISGIYRARGDYETALSYLEQSLTIQKEIGDAAGLCATLFNMGHIYWENEEQQAARQAWIAVYQLAQPMGLAQALDALTNLADQLGLPGGLDGWAKLAQQVGTEVK